MTVAGSTASDSGRLPRIVYVSWPATEISGGIKAAFQHVEMLTEAGLDAHIASRDTRAPGWFETGAKILGLDQVGAGDILVFPENSAELFKASRRLPQPQGSCSARAPCWRRQGMGTLSSCADARHQPHHVPPATPVLHYCRRRFPGVKLGYTPFYVDALAVHLHPRQDTCRSPACRANGPMNSRAIVDLFRAVVSPAPRPGLGSICTRPVKRRWPRSWAAVGRVPLAGRDLASRIGMTTLEAMASGCILAGYSGVAGGTDTATVRNRFLGGRRRSGRLCRSSSPGRCELAIDRDHRPTTRMVEGPAQRTAHEYPPRGSGPAAAGILEVGIAAAGAALIRRPAPPAVRSRSRSGACSAATRARRSGRCLRPARPEWKSWPVAG